MTEKSLQDRARELAVAQLDSGHACCGCGDGEWNVVLEKLGKILEAERAKVARLREALDETVSYLCYHSPGCSGAFPTHHCKCGVGEARNKALRALKETEEVKP